MAVAWVLLDWRIWTALSRDGGTGRAETEAEILPALETSDQMSLAHLYYIM